jgi:hypothetical protein
MSDNQQNPKFDVGDVPKGRRFHEITASKPNDIMIQDSRYLLDSKERPMLVIGTPPSKIAEYQTLDFTSRAPTEKELSNYLLKENGKPRCFGVMLGFDLPSYLKTYPIRSCHEKVMRESKINPFSREFVDSVIKIAFNRMLHTEKP